MILSMRLLRRRRIIRRKTKSNSLINSSAQLEYHRIMFFLFLRDFTVITVCMGKNREARKLENKKSQIDSNLKAVGEHERKLEVIQDQINKMSLKIATLQRSQRVAKLSASQIDAIPPSASCKYYSQVGKMFLMAPRDEILNSLAETCNEVETELPRLLKTYSQFDNLKKEQLDSIKDLYDAIKA